MTTTNLCEWDPDNDRPACGVPRQPETHTGCKNVATLSVGSQNWHLCASCAGLPKFSRLRRRVALKEACPGCGHELCTSDIDGHGDCSHCEYFNLRCGRSHYCGRNDCYCRNLRGTMRQEVLDSFIAITGQSDGARRAGLATPQPSPERCGATNAENCGIIEDYHTALARAEGAF
jgi:hypothetical protein